MQRAGLLSVFAIGLLMSAASYADDESAAVAPKTLDDYVDAAGELTFSNYYISDLAAPEFQDNSPLARIRRIRDLPLLTLSETHDSRMFLGVNRDGIFGIHLRAR